VAAAILAADLTIHGVTAAEIALQGLILCCCAAILVFKKLN
jgi:hypothetical protein